MLGIWYSNAILQCLCLIRNAVGTRPVFNCQEKHKKIQLEKPIGELARALLSFKRPTRFRVYGAPPQQRSDDTNDSLSKPANFTLPMRASLLYAARCKTGLAIAALVKSADFRSGCGGQGRVETGRQGHRSASPAALHRHHNCLDYCNSLRLPDSVECRHHVPLKP